MHIVIIGNGISGITAARFIRKLSDHRVTVISAESEYFFSRTALMYVYMGHMRFEDIQPYEQWFWKKNRINLHRGYVTGVVVPQKQVVFDTGEVMPYDKLIIATGSRSAADDWPGQELKGVQGLYSYQDLQSMEESTPGLKHAVIVGGGLIGIEMAEMFRSRNIDVTMMVREKSFYNKQLPPEESQMVNHEIRTHGIQLKLETELSEIIGDDRNNVQAVITKQGERIPCQFVGLTIGVTPNIGIFNQSGIDFNKGILVDEELRTSIPDIYAIGDCAELRSPQHGRKAIEPVWYSGRIMGETAAYNICGYHIPYEPGLWFNSAKFFNIEYQVYGSISPDLPEDQFSLYWEHPNGRKSIRINFRKETSAVVGFNLMGIRYRQEVCEKWISLGVPISEVLENLSMANFDPEFSSQYEKELISLYNQQFESALSHLKRRGLHSVTQYLGF